MNQLKAAPVEIKWHSGLPIFASEAFLKSEADEYGWIGGIDKNGQLRCALPYAIIRKAYLRLVRFRTETISMGEEITLDEEKTFLNNVVEYFRSTIADIIIPGANTALFRVCPDGAMAAPYGTFIKHLDKPEEELWNELHADYRQNIRKAAKKGVSVKGGPEYLETAYPLLVDTLKRSGLKFKSFREFEKRLSNLGDNAKIFIAESEGAVQACMVSPFSLHSAYDWYSGTISKPVRGAMHLLIWEAIRQFRQLGVKKFNFTGVRTKPDPGSKQEGIMNFKMRFGGELVYGHMWKYSFHPVRSFIYSLGVRVLMGGDIVDVERKNK